MTVENPTISIALLVKNGMPGLKELLSILSRQQGCQPFEIVAVDSGSTDGSLEEMQRMGVRITQIPPETFQFGPTRQKAFELTRGRVILTMSQDALPAGDRWLAEMTDPILAGQVEIMQATEQATISEQNKLAILNYTSPHNHWVLPYSEISCVGMAIARTAWEQTGFGTAKMSEDKWIGMRARDKGFRMGKNEKTPLLHGHDYTLMGHIKRSFNEGMGARDTEGLYSFTMMLKDVFAFSRYRIAASAVIKHRRISLYQASWFPLRPIFVYIGWRFGKKYWR